MRKSLRPGLFLGLFFVLVSLAWAQSAPAQASSAPQSAAGPTAGLPAQPAFDVKAATDAYLAKVPADKKARSDAYFEGGYWLILWDFLYSAAIFLLLLEARWSARMRDLAERITHRKPLQTALYYVQFLIAVTVLGFPLTVYEGYIREHQYGLATQSFGPWMRDLVVTLALGMVLGSILLTALFGIVRRLGRTWWMWGAAVVTVFFAFVLLIGPVYIAPLFNTYKRLEDPKIKDPILNMARANGIPVTEVYQVDASRQSTRVSANVSGFLGTERITLNDNLLKRCSPAEIQAVMGHEMGHYVLNHVYKGLLFSGVVTVIAFAYLNWGLGWALRRRGERWGVRGITDVAVIPLAALLFSIFGFVFT
ncbi:MAG: M48 family metallopeptidase, partial [Burkholderiales bacterium]